MSAPGTAKRPSLAKKVTWEFTLIGALLALSTLGLGRLFFGAALPNAPASGPWTWLSFGALSVALGIGAGRLMGRRYARHLGLIVERLRNLDEPTDTIKLDAEPDEVRAVVEALRAKLLDIQGLTKTARLMNSGLGHELRAPLQNLVGELEVALMRDREPAEYREVLRGQKEELRRLSRMVENLVALCSAHESRRQGLQERFDFGAEADIRLLGERKFASAREVELRIETLGSLECEGDRESTLLILRNLVTTAIEMSPKGGAVHVLLSGENDAIEVVVDDSGCKAVPGEQDKIFDPLGGGRNGTSVAQGVGLALTKHAVGLHGGTIEAKDSPLGGMRFSVSLPRKRA